MKTSDIIEMIESAIKIIPFDKSMQNMMNQWFLDDRYYIENDLGCTIEHYDWLIVTKQQLIELQSMGIEDITLSINDRFYIEKTRAIIQLNLETQNKPKKEMIK